MIRMLSLSDSPLRWPERPAWPRRRWRCLAEGWSPRSHHPPRTPAPRPVPCPRPPPPCPACGPAEAVACETPYAGPTGVSTSTAPWRRRRRPGSAPVPARKSGNRTWERNVCQVNIISVNTLLNYKPRQLLNMYWCKKSCIQVWTLVYYFKISMKLPLTTILANYITKHPYGLTLVDLLTIQLHCNTFVISLFSSIKYSSKCMSTFLKHSWK